MRVLPMSDGMILQSSRDDLRGHDAINRPMRGKEERKSSRHLKVRALEHWHYGLCVLQCQHAR